GVGQRGGGEVEEAPDAGGVARGAAAGFGRRGHACRDRAEAAGAALEAIADLGLNTLERPLIRSSEADALDGEAGRTGHKRGNDAGAHDAQDEGHVSSQDTRVL